MENKDGIEYTSFFKTQFIAGLLFLSVGITSLIFYDYGLLSFLFALPQFFLTGLIPMIMGLLIIIRCIFDREKVGLKQENEELQINSSKWRFKKKEIELKFKKSEIRYMGLRYKETRELRWIIIIILIVFAIEVHYQNAIDLYGYARIAPMLAIWTILLFIGIILFTFSPRRYLEFANEEETIYIPFKQLPKADIQNLLHILDIDSGRLQRRKSVNIISSNIKYHFFDFILGVYLLVLGILLMLTPTIYLGSFTRAITITYGMKLLLRVFNGDPYFSEVKEDNNLFIGNSPRLTFIQGTTTDTNSYTSFTPLRIHPFEILCIFYLIYQAIRYAFRNFWWEYAEFSISYFIIGIVLVSLLFFRWFKPINMIQLKYREFSLKIKIQDTSSIIEKFKGILSNFKTLPNDKLLLISVIIYLFFIVWPIFYIMFGGNFLIIQ